MQLFDFGLADDPDVWDRCFGLADNPFSPRSDKARPLSQLGLETKPLRPHVKGYDWLYPEYYARADTNRLVVIGERLDSFITAVKVARPTVNREGLIFLVYGSPGCGKTSFSNLCRFAVANSFPGVESIDFDPDDVGPLTSRDSIKAYLEAQIPKPSVSAEALKNSPNLITILVENISPSLLVGANFEINQAFQFLMWLYKLAKPHGVPLILATTWEKDLLGGFAKRPMGAATEGHELPLREFRDDDVLCYIRSRIRLFRGEKEWPASVTEYFPFDEKSIRDCFKQVKSQEVGSLPVRNVNRILARALLLKKEKLEASSNPLTDFGPGLTTEEILERTITKTDLLGVAGSITGE